MQKDKLRSTIEQKIGKKYGFNKDGMIPIKAIRAFCNDTEACEVSALYQYVRGHRGLPYNSLVSVLDALKVKMS